MSDLYFGEFGADIAPPVVTNPSPTGVDRPRNSNIEFDITDTDSGVNTATVIVVVAGTIAYSAGAPKNGYAGSFLDTGGGTWHMLLIPPSPHANLTTINITVDADDMAGNTMSTFGWPFVTADEIAPVVTNNVPTGLAEPQTVNVVFDIGDDGAGVDLANTVVKIGGVVAYDGVNFVNGYDGLESAVTGAPASYHLVVDRETIYAGLTLYDVDVDSRDLAANVMATFSWPFTTEAGDVVGPVFSNKSPTTTNVDRNTNIGFRVADVLNDVDDTTINATVNGQIAITGGGPGPDYSVTLSPIVQGYDVVIDPDSDLKFDETYTVYAEAEDTRGNPSSTTWQFTTVQGLIVSPILQASAGNERVSLTWSLPPPELMRQERFDLRRSLTAFPETPADGDLIYRGLNRYHIDLDVDNGITYHYTVFVLRKPGEYVPYDARASDTGRPRLVKSAVIRGIEYVPVRGDFGAKTVNPMPYGTTTDIWGSLVGETRRQSDLVSVPLNRVVRAPVQGTVRDVVDYVGVSKTIEIEVASGIVVYLSGILVTVARGESVEAGQVVGRTVGGRVELGVYKLSTMTVGRRTVRPRYFYLTTENRDGRE